LISGAGKGLGRALALAFASAGAIVAADDITPIHLDETVRLVQAAGGRIHPYIFDVAKGMPARALVNEVLNDLGRLDVLVNNAAIRPYRPLADMDEWDWQRTLDVNLSGPFLLMQAAFQPMKEQGSGVIFNVAGEETLAAPESGYSAYYATKAGLAALSRAAAEEFFAYNIRIHTIYPGETAALSVVPAPDWMQSIAGFMLPLCSPEAAHLTGQMFRFDRAG
jgi:NAD(P)-dependent dehydrogenase (short-subunit alcohol dehydrogenase family)